MNSWFGPYETRWPVVPLREFASLGTGHTPSRDVDEYWQNCTIPWVTVEDIRANGIESLKPLLETKQKISQLGLENSAAVIHPTGTVMLSRTASIGFSCVIGCEMATTQAFVAWTPDPKALDSHYLLAVLRTMREHFSSIAYGATHLTIYFPDIKKLRIPLPAIELQTQIARFLDYETAKIDALIEKQQQLIALLKEKRQAVISHAVTKGLNPDAPMCHSGVEWLGEVPNHWKVTRLKHVVEMYGRIGFRGYATTDIVDEGEGAIVLSPSNIDDRGFTLKKTVYLSWEKYFESPEIMLVPGDIMLVKTGWSFGKVTSVTEVEYPMTVNPQMLLLKKAKIDPRYIAHFLQTEALQAKISTINSGSYMPTMSQNNVGELPLLTPPKQEAEEISQHLERISSKYDGLLDRQAEAITLLQERRNALISAAVTGKIDLRNWQPPESEIETEVA